jgi:hypothetical protein
MRVRSAFCIVHFAWLIACAPSRPPLLPVALPDLSRVDQAVQSRAHQRYESLMQKMKSSPDADARICRCPRSNRKRPALSLRQLAATLTRRTARADALADR